ncbi:hypothetical protein C2845_PM04G20530 [Panicum miliaceum]|uniref:Uncharacterized protein n=1 Tax=Panicum miliaceum TaxID=4540 RepID=A0A3L6QRA7_PANMI|nr:hypothetical protein C2845_PM04G20530 [Panicum miliaceum]
MPRRGNKRKLEETARDPVPCQIARSSSDSPSVYLVVGHEVCLPSYSVYKVQVESLPDDGGGGGGAPRRIRRRRRLRPVASLYSKHRMSFVPFRSRLGPWIVGVGGDYADEDYGPGTIVFDTKTQEAIAGPKLVSTKPHPVLLPVGDRIYALSSSPSVKEDPDFVPWFEMLDLSEAQVADGRLEMPWPPYFPWELTPRQYILPLEVTVKSYAEVGSCILVSVTGQTGTHMFDTGTEQWSKLDDEDLPFVSGAIPHGPLLFLGLSPRGGGKITAYKITVTTGCPSLSIVEFPVVADWEVVEEVASAIRFVPG